MMVEALEENVMKDILSIGLEQMRGEKRKIITFNTEQPQIIFNFPFRADVDINSSSSLLCASD